MWYYNRFTPRSEPTTEPEGGGDATAANQQQLLARLELVVADQVREGDTIRYYKKGTNQTILLGTQTTTGDPCDGDVSIVWE